MWPFKSKTFTKVITHEDWRDYGGEPAVMISPKEHKCGKNPRHQIDSLSKTPYVKVLLDGSVMLYRGLKIEFGTRFQVKISLEK